MKYRKKPVVVEAIRYDGTNKHKIKTFLGLQPFTQDRETSKEPIVIHTEEGFMRAQVGDWIIKGVKGEIYPCKPDIFEQTYEKVED